MHDILLPSSRATRLRNSYRYPEEAALAARLPLVGRRVPTRAYWRRRPLHMFELPREMAASGFLPFGGRFRRGSDSRAQRIRRRVSATGAVAADAFVRPVINRAPRIGRFSLERPQLRVPDLPRPSNIEVPIVSNIEMPRLHRDEIPGRRLSSRALLVGAAIGLLAMFYFDPASGRRRRALVRDKFARVRHIFTRDMPRRIEKRARFSIRRGMSRVKMCRTRANLSRTRARRRRPEAGSK